jgi:ribosomal RNA-processing protein 12
LYGSESEIEDSDEDTHISTSEKKNIGQGARLRLDDDEPMDLLQGAAVKITSRT